jgi:hypothetical protein
MAQGFIWDRPVEHRIDAQLLGALIISWVPGSMDEATGSASLGAFFGCHFGFFSSAIRGSSSYCL